MITIDKVFKPRTYTAEISGNSGEEALAIHMSPSQRFETKMVIVAVQIDGGADVVLKPCWVSDKDLPQTLFDTIWNWVNRGIKPDERQATKLATAALKAVKKICRDFGFDYGPNRLGEVILPMKVR